MAVYKLDPLTDPRWPVFLERNADASIFHTPGWLEALRQTYGYEPLVYTTCPPGVELTNGIPFCHVNSWVTGRRLVSLPFSDHCELLVDGPDTLQALLAAAKQDAENEGRKYVELRPLKEQPEIAEIANSFGKNVSFYFHRIDLAPDMDEIYAQLHKTSVKQMIQRAEREGLVCHDGASDALLDQFYELLVSTRRKHQIPPQPRRWFHNVLDCLGDNARLHVASKDGDPVASIITCAQGQTHYYKYGCSDPKYTNLGGTALLLWRAIYHAKKRGIRWFDMGRSDTTNVGLVKFKERWGAERTTLTYFRSPMPQDPHNGEKGWKIKLAKCVFSWLPDRLLVTAGGILYRHIG